MSYLVGAFVQAVDAPTVCAYPDGVGVGLLIERQDAVFAQSVVVAQSYARKGNHVGFPYVDEASAGSSQPDVIAFPAAVYVQYGVDGQGMQVTRFVFEHLYAAVFGVDDVDTSSVGSGPDFSFYQGDTEYEVAAEG